VLGLGGIVATGLVQQVQTRHVGLLCFQKLLDDPLLRLLPGKGGEKERLWLCFQRHPKKQTS
jgi:hypothetical protein